MASLAVVIPTLGRTAPLGRVLSLLAEQSGDVPDLDLVVSADARADLREVERAANGLPVVQGARAGASAARNAGWRATTAHAVLFLGDDILPRPGLLASHARFHEEHPGTETAVLGHVRWARELPRTAFMTWLEHGMQFDYPSIAGEEAGWGRFNTANASVKRALLTELDGFDEELPFLYEDLDLARRADGRGFRLLYAREAVGEHLHPPTIEGWEQRMELVGSAERHFVAKHPDVPAYFHDMFAAATALPPARGRLAPLIRFVPRGLPLLGPRAWGSADALYRQRLAPAFMRGWDAGPPAG